MPVETLAIRLAELVDPRLAVFILSLLPVVEPRYGVLIGVTLLDVGPIASLAASLAALAILSMGLPWLVDYAISLLERLSSRIKVAEKLSRILARIEASSANRARRHVEQLKLIGLVIFVAVPLPMTGVYSGALAARALGFRGWKASLALFTGGAISIGLTLAPVLILSATDN